MENKIICMRGNEERHQEVRKFFDESRARETDEFSFNVEEYIYYIDPITEAVRTTEEGERAYDKLLPHLTELAPLEEKVEEVEFWLKPFDKVVVRNNENTLWSIELFERKSENVFAVMYGIVRECLPFNAETEKLLGTYDNPKTKYVFKGVKSYFDEE